MLSCIWYVSSWPESSTSNVGVKEALGFGLTCTPKEPVCVCKAESVPKTEKVSRVGIVAVGLGLRVQPTVVLDVGPVEHAPVPAPVHASV